MIRVRMTIEFILDESFGVSEDDLMWLENEVLVGDGNLILHSNDIGDSVGVIKKVRNIQYLGNSEQEDKRSVARDDDSSNADDQIKTKNNGYTKMEKIIEQADVLLLSCGCDAPFITFNTI